MWQKCSSSSRATAFIVLAVDLCLLIPLYHYSKKFSDPYVVGEPEWIQTAIVLDLDEAANITNKPEDEPQPVALDLHQLSLKERKSIFHFKSKVYCLKLFYNLKVKAGNFGKLIISETFLYFSVSRLIRVKGTRIDVEYGNNISPNLLGLFSSCSHSHSHSHYYGNPFSQKAGINGGPKEKQTNKETN